MILIVGGKGFVGREIVNSLRERNIEYEIFYGDITSSDAYENYNNNYAHVIHSASIITHRGLDNDNLLERVNIYGTSMLLSFFSNARFIYISTKDVNRDVLSAYAKTKVLAEKMVMKNSSKNLIFRLPSVFGGNSKQKKLIPLLIDKYINETPCEILNNDRREYIYVKKCASEIVDHMYKNGVINMDGIFISNLDLDMLIKDIVNEDYRHSKHKVYKAIYNQLQDTIHESLFKRI